MPKCKSCDAEIYWVKTKKGKAMPVDMDSVDQYYTIHGKMPTEFRQEGILTSHFATCPNANEFRQKEAVGAT